MGAAEGSGGSVRGLTVVTVAASENSRGRLARALGDEERCDVIAELEGVDGLAHLADAPDAIVIEGGSGRQDRVREVRRAFPKAALVVVVPGDSRKQLRAALAEGADGIVLEGRLTETLSVTILATSAQQMSVPRELRTAIVKPALSVREKQVLGMAIMGLTNGEIAAQLVLAESTIKSHLSSAFVKLGVRSRGEASELILDPANGLGPGILSIAGSDSQLGRDLEIEEPSSLVRR
jgi:DNA-binding NarL/FixJ family response regulator